MTALPLLKPYVFNKRGHLYKVIRCPRCGKPRLRAVAEEILARDDPRLGNAHIHKCCLIDGNYFEQKSRDAEFCLRAYGKNS